jgi:hypothetical protein
MNNPEVTMHENQQSTRLDALEKATTAAGIAISLVMRVPAPLKPIADQVIRSASSVPANLAEGAGAVDDTQSATALQLFDDVRAMTWRLLHPKP